MSSIKRKKSIGKDYGRRPYVTDDDYQLSMRRIPDRAVYNEVLVKQSELKKPYQSDSYNRMEYQYDGPSWQPIYNKPIDQDVVPPKIIDDAEKYLGLVYCFLDACYCPGQVTCFPINCTYPLKGATASNSDVGISFSKDEICFDVSEGISGSFSVDLILTLPENHVKHQPIDISECLPSQCCGCIGISIGYTTQQMAVNEQQTLTVIGAVSGCTYNWAITSGGGSLSSNTGTSVIYTAPSTNSDCSNNPIITLSLGATLCDTLNIAINQWMEKGYDNEAVAMKIPTSEGCGDGSSSCFPWVYDPEHVLTCCYRLWVWYCDGTLYCNFLVGGNAETTDCEECYAFVNPGVLCWKLFDSSGYPANTYYDVRKPYLKENGCCPVQLL